MAKITLKNIGQFIEGNWNLLYDRYHGQPKYIKEQLAYRASKCQDCFALGRCIKCGCDLPGKHYVGKSCNNGERFPDLMDEKHWEVYKVEHGIEIELDDN